MMVDRDKTIMAILTFREAIDDSVKRYGGAPHLLLGNGFSIACRPDIFRYGKLYEQADFSALSPYVKSVFEELKTQDFEHVIKALRDAALLLGAYKDASADLIEQIKKDADALRDLLVQTIAASHPAYPGDLTESEYAACRSFLSHFKTTYTFNYDLLLYWVHMHVEEGKAPSSDDGFRKKQDDFDAAYVTWEPSQSHEQNMYFLHGALHVFDAGTEVQKYTWRNTGVRLIDQIRDALSRNYFPLFVSEGTSEEKYERIRHSDYLAKAYRSFCEIQGSLFIFGHSLAPNDEHYLRAIENGKLAHLYIGLHGDPASESNVAITRRAEAMTRAYRRKPLAVAYFDTASANVWGR
jgi:Domain of unknown function (DUF4917)